MLTGLFKPHGPTEAIDLSSPASRRPFETYGHGPLVGDVIADLRALRDAGELSEADYTVKVTEALGGYANGSWLVAAPDVAAEAPPAGAPADQ